MGRGKSALLARYGRAVGNALKHVPPGCHRLRHPASCLCLPLCVQLLQGGCKSYFRQRGPHTGS